MYPLTTFREIDNAAEIFRSSVKILENHRVKWFVGFGTALGLHRDQDFIPNDTDFDFLVIGDEQEKSLGEAFSVGLELIRDLEKDGKAMQKAFQHENGIIVDLCFYHPHGDYLYSHHDEKIWKDKAYLFDEPDYRETKYGLVPFPKPVEKYLSARYGDWWVKQEQKSNEDSL